MSNITINMAELCNNGILDNLYPSLSFLVSLNVIQKDKADLIYKKLPVLNQSQVNNLSGLIELSKWIMQIYSSYNSYNKYSQEILDSIPDDINHIVSNYKKYITTDNSKNKKQIIDIDFYEFNKLYSTLKDNYSNLSLFKHLEEIKTILENNDNTDISQKIDVLYTKSRELEYSSLSPVLIRKIKSVLNKIRLQYENILNSTSNTSNNLNPNSNDTFLLFLREEGIYDTVNFILEKILTDT